MPESEMSGSDSSVVDSSSDDPDDSSPDDSEDPDDPPDDSSDDSEDPDGGTSSDDSDGSDEDDPSPASSCGAPALRAPPRRGLPPSSSDETDTNLERLVARRDGHTVTIPGRFPIARTFKQRCIFFHGVT